MPETKTCSECGAVIPATSREGYCPKCLLGLANTVALDEVNSPRRSGSEGNSPSGSVLSNYELLEQIGEGGMGVVYKARQRGLNRIVALKMIRSGSLASESEVKRFRSEAQAAARLQHPNVVAIHEVGEHEGRPFFTMDFIEGQNLAQVAQGTPLGAERAARYVQTIAEAVHCAHQLGILHRDLKPANILLDRNDQPRITDFGLAKQLESDPGLTMSGAILGTPSYMPPEQAAGKRKDMGPACDVYSLGAVLYDLLTGRPPFRADTPLDTLRQVVEAAPAPPRLLNPKVPRDLETICLKCLAKNPGQRYPTAQELADDLGRALKHEPIRARPVGRLGRLMRWCRRNPAVAGLLAGTVLLLVMMTIAAVFFRRDAINGNHDDIQSAAEMIRLQLLPLRESVQQAAKATTLRELLANNDLPGLTNFLARAYAGYGAPDHPLQVENWMLVGTNGRMLARWPEAILPNDLSHRDYFRGAKQAAEDEAATAYVSRVYKSLADKRDKFAVCMEVRDEFKTDFGVMAAMVTTQSTQGRLGLTTERRQTVVIAQGETNASSGEAQMSEFVVMLHPDFDGHTLNAVPVDNARLLALLREMMKPEESSAGIRRISWYLDPVPRDHPKFPGRRLTSLAQVKATPFIVICETRDYVADAVISAFCVVLVAGVALVGWRFVHRRRNR